MSIPHEKTGVETPTPIQLSRDSLSSSHNSRNIDNTSDETNSPITEKTDSPPADDNAEAANPQGTAPDGAEASYKPGSLKFWLIIISAFVSMFLVALDRTIISTAIPTITDDFHSLSDIGWYGSSYMLTTAAFQLIWGRIYRFYDLRWTFLCCIVIFEVGSAICGSAPSSSVFIAGKCAMRRRENMNPRDKYLTNHIGRAIAGVGSAGITTGSLLTTIDMIPLAKRPMFQGTTRIPKVSDIEFVS